MINYIITDRAMTLFIDGKIHTLHAQDKRWDDAIAAVKQQDKDLLLAIVNPAVKLANYVSASGRLRVVEGVVKFDGQSLPDDLYIVRRLVTMLEADMPIDPMINFIENLMANPSHRAMKELLQFVEFGSLPITPDGHFLAYKKIRVDYTDIHTGKFDNSIGTVVKMPRNMVDEDSDRTCSSGLHVCSYEYLRHFGSSNLGHDMRIIVCKINPADVVAVPRDYDNTKMRVCRYEVISELELNEDILRDVGVYDEFEDDYEDDFEDESYWAAD